LAVAAAAHRADATNPQANKAKQRGKEEFESKLFGFILL
jgi:hypothetical protein